MRDFSLVKFLPINPKVPFIKARLFAGLLSVVLVIASLFLFFTKGLNYGIDFTGGTVIEVDMKGPPDFAAVRTTVNDLYSGTQVQGIDAPAGSNVDYQYIRVGIPMQEETEELGSQTQQVAMKNAEDALRVLSPNLEVRAQESVSGQVSGELRRKGFMAVGLAMFMVLGYIWFRFEWQFGLGAVVALAHDVILTLGFFELTQIEFNLSIVAAVLTIIGYSLNDTVVVYDRIRENLRKYKTKPLPEVLNLSINDTLSRTILTSMTTLLALFALNYFGGEGLHGFSLAMIWGVVIGTYSSIFVASPLLLLLKLKRGANTGGELATA
jgi:preprotein translocase SecF subunit